MPFQVVYSAKKNPISLITYVNAGPDQYAICANDITLSATVLTHGGETGEDIIGHTYLWEQISGDPITWTSPVDQLEVTYTNEGDHDDKTFRFWLDKNTGYQRYDDVIIFGTPTSFCYTSGISNPAVASWGLEATGYQATLSEVAGFAIDEASASDSLSNNNTALLWTYPQNQFLTTSTASRKIAYNATIIQYELQVRATTADPWVTQQIYPAGSTIRVYPNPTNNMIYRLVTIVRGRGHQIFGIPSNTVYTVGAVARKVHASSMFVQSSYYTQPVISTFTVTLLQNIKFTYSTSTTTSSYNAGPIVTNYVVTYYIIIKFAYESSNVASSYNAGPIVTNYIVTILNGTDVGGD